MFPPIHERNHEAVVQDQTAWDDETEPLRTDGGAMADGTSSPHGTGKPAKGQSVDGYLQTPGQEEDDGRGLLGGEGSNAGSIEVRVAGQRLMCWFQPGCLATLPSALAGRSSHCSRARVHNMHPCRSSRR